MDSPLLEYSSDIDTTIAKAVEKELHVSIISVERLLLGEFNYVYKILTTKEPLLARVFRVRNSPEDGKLTWIEKQLTERRISHAKTIYYTRESTYFPYGYMVQEYINGENGFDAIMDNTVSFESFFDKLVVLLQKVHSVSIKGYGDIHDGIGEYASFYESKLAWYKKNRERLSSLTDIEESIHEAVLLKLQDLKKHEKNFNSVLLHNDPTPGNTIYTQQGEIILIDWDNSGSGIWVSEYAGLTARGAFMWQYSTEDERNRIIKKAFKEYYKGVDFDNPAVLAIIEVLHLLTAYHSLTVHYFQHQDLELYNRAKKTLISMLKL